MHGAGHRRNCPTCGQSVAELRDVLGNRELRGPRQITSSNIDRIFDDGGNRFLICEEKAPTERVSEGQKRLLINLARIPCITVWGVRGTPDELAVTHITPMKKRLVASGNFDAYQSAVNDWFRWGPQDDPWTWHRLEALCGAPFEPPADVPEGVDWRVIDRALVQIATAMKGES